MVKISYTGRASTFVITGITRAEADAAVLGHLHRFRFEIPKGKPKTFGDAREMPHKAETPLHLVSAVWIDDTDPSKIEPLVIPTKLPPAPR